MRNRSDQRQFTRLHYKLPQLMPMALIKGDEFAVSEVSEKGIRVKGCNGLFPTIGMSMTAEIYMHSGLVAVAGEVIRFNGDETVFLLSTTISPQQMVSEQRFLEKKHPNVFPPEKQPTPVGSLIGKLKSLLGN